LSTSVTKIYYNKTTKNICSTFYLQEMKTMDLLKGLNEEQQKAVMHASLIMYALF